jgi:hypothetical protein
MTENEKLRALLKEAREVLLPLADAEPIAEFVHGIDDALAEHEHRWEGFHGLTACSTCGVIKRADGANKPCRGKVDVTLRDDELAAAQRRAAKLESDLVAVCALLHQARHLITDIQNEHGGRLRDRIDIVLAETEKSL